MVRNASQGLYTIGIGPYRVMAPLQQELVKKPIMCVRGLFLGLGILKLVLNN